MRGSTARRLLDLNRAFYQSFAEPFAASRERLQPGIPAALAGLDLSGPFLDLGCSEGRVGRHLRRSGFPGGYLGVDGCARLLERGRAADPSLEFLEADLAGPGWENAVRRIHPQFASAGCFSLLHHLPGPGRRRRLLAAAAALLCPGGRLALSVWQPLRSQRLRGRVVPWEQLGFEAGGLEPGDLLVAWNRGAAGVRYVHHFEEEELLRLVRGAGLEPLELFHSDGEGGRLGLYVLARRGREEARDDSRAAHRTFTESRYHHRAGPVAGPGPDG